MLESENQVSYFKDAPAPTNQNASSIQNQLATILLFHNESAGISDEDSLPELIENWEWRIGTRQRVVT
jgi:hypothetical protein